MAELEDVDITLRDELSLLSFDELEDEVVAEESPNDVIVSIGPELYRLTKLDCSSQFMALPERLQFYYHYVTEACWCGSLIVFFQTSLESPAILLFLLKLLTQQGLAELRISSEEHSVSQDDFDALVIYAARFFSAGGNHYKGHKFTPGLPQSMLFATMEGSLAWANEYDLMQKLWKLIVIPMYSANADAGASFLGPSEWEREDIRVVTEYLVGQNIPIWNVCFTKSLTRQGTLYDVKLASVDKGEDTEYALGPEMCHFKVTKGDYAFILKEVIRNLLTAKLYVDNDLEKEMIDLYITSFRTGDVAAHKQGSRLWMDTDSSHAVWYLGFIELLQNPAHGFSEFQGFVGLLNHDAQHFYKQFLESAGELIHLLPWDKEYEMENFITPKLKMVDLLMFCGSMMPHLKNVPVYEDVQDVEGFKSIVFCNLILNNATSINIEEAFLLPEDVHVLWKYADIVKKLHLGLKLVIGHGSGKMFRKVGKHFNFPVRKMRHPIFNDKIRTWYIEGETFSTKFGELSVSLEECRAICVAMYLSSFPEVVSLFDVAEEESEDVIYASWLLQIYSSITNSLHGYDALSKKWFDQKAQANFVILRMFLEAKERVVHVSEPEYGKKIIIHVDRTKILTAGRKCLGDFVTKLHIFKCTADVTSARKLYNYYSTVPDEGRYPLGRWEMLSTTDHHVPIRLYVQCNTLHVQREQDRSEGEQLGDIASDGSATAGRVVPSLPVTPQVHTGAAGRTMHGNPHERKKENLLDINNTRGNSPHTSQTSSPNSGAAASPDNKSRGANTTSRSSATPQNRFRSKENNNSNENIINSHTKNQKSRNRNSNTEGKVQTQQSLGNKTTPLTSEGDMVNEMTDNEGMKLLTDDMTNLTSGMLGSGQSDETDRATSPLPALTDRFSQLVRKVTMMKKDAMLEEAALMQSFYERPYHPLLKPASVADLHAGRGVALELMERVLKYGEDAVGGAFQLLVERDSDDYVDSVTDTDITQIASEQSTPPAESILVVKKAAYPMTDGLPEGISVKKYPLTAEGLVESFLDKCPSTVVSALTQQYLSLFVVVEA